ncbi:hypothetical protein QJS04_geneDACA015562 [Acorus gramineus]|uniref:Rhodanese domain-containing protein n=1 Tax=Acorus gramineus TaxID=55184 RepID=A0AAV9ARB7_ACOGR|nr:hypothetical protein QJS04_geneDACA015562 [Acorus gramineus]
MMLPVCFAAASCSSQCQISSHVGLGAFSLFRRAAGDRCIVEDRVSFNIGIHDRGISLKSHALKSPNSLYVETPDQLGSAECPNITSYPSEFDDIVAKPSKDYFYKKSEELTGLLKEVNASQSELTITNGVGGDVSNELSSQSSMVEPLTSSSTPLESAPPLNGDELLNIPESFLSSNADSNVFSTNSISVSSKLEAANNELSGLKESFQKFLGEINNTVNASINEARDFVNDTYRTATSSLTYTVKSVSETSEKTASNFSSEFKESTFRTAGLAVDILRQSLVAVGGTLTKATDFVIYSYGSAKDMLPPDIRDPLNLLEERALAIVRPVGTALHQVYVVIEGLERNLGLDPSDPLVLFVFSIGGSVILGISYWRLNYGGYSGDLSPEESLELLRKENAILVDVRTEDLRKRDGIPDLRRGARFKYASIILPEMDTSVRKQLKNHKEVDDALIATVIRNLKVSQNDSKVIIMDASGARSKGIARYLRRLGVKNAYLVGGGFLSWVESGLRIKEIRPETALTLLNEETEAILEDIKPTPLLVLGYGVGFIAAVYALLEWEKTLQLIGIIGLGQTIYRRVASYEDSEDFNQDVRLLLAPVRLGAQAFSWAAGKLEPNRIGLPTSPSSTAVQDRVLQAAAKHESQPSDSGDAQASSSSENLDLSEV